LTRIYDRLEGLAVSGRATIGSIGLSVPGVIWSQPQGRSEPLPGGPGSLSLSDDRTAPPGRRSLRLSDGVSEIGLEFPVGTPEVSGTPGDAVEAGPGTSIVHWPLAAEPWTRLREHPPELVVLSNARALFSDAEEFVRAIGELRAQLGAGPLLWTPRIGLPHRLAPLAYLGVDLVDSTEGLARTIDGEFFVPELGAFDASASIGAAACPCPACRADPLGGRVSHNEWALDREMRLVRAALRAGRLRELVEARLTAEPVLAELLRYADRLLGNVLEERAPVTASGTRTYILKESQRRPEVVRFRQRFLERYRPPPSKQVLLIVPCSRTKPYRSSPSHRRILNALEGVPNRARLHVASVTSPLGLVPRELEDVPPARHYDIPVTHEWDEDERRSVIDAVRHVIGTGGYRSVLVHLDPTEYGFLRDALATGPETQWTVVDGRSGSADSLRRLRDAAEASLGPLPAVEGGTLAVVREELEAIATYQFGRDAAQRLFQVPLRLHGRPWFQRVTDGHGSDLATWREGRGFFQLTIAGGTRMAPAHPLEVEVRPEVPMMGDLFVPGVAKADPQIRIGDAVLLVREGKLLAVGEAALPGPLMGQLGRGLAVRLRHRTREPGPDPLPTGP
jgi:archaeosine synthase alpha-subunit